MASLFRARRSEEGRSGGKILRGRRAAPSASPYLRPRPPLPPSPPPAAAQAGSPRWLRGLISGTGKLISSLFRSDSSSPASTSSSGYSSDEDGSSGYNEDENGFSSKELHELDQRGKKSEVITDLIEGSLAIVRKSDSKLAIEQLLMQETFSRDEGDKLVKLIQSRVLGLPSAEVCDDGTQELLNKSTGRDTVLPGASRSLSQTRKLPEKITYSSSNLLAFSPGSSARELHTPDACHKAVMEAKNWLEEKKLASSSKYDLECGPCTLNTDMLQYGIECEAGSPVDMAKSYMQSLPPWRYPSLSSVGFKTPPPSRMPLYDGGTSYATSVNSLPSSKVLKRDHISIGSWDLLDEIRRVRLKSTDAMLEVPKSKQIESSATLFERESSKVLPASDKREPHMKNHCSDEALRFSDEKDVEVNCPVETANIAETVNEVQLTISSSTPTVNPLEPTHSEKDVEEPSQTREQDESVFVPHDSLASAPTVMEHGGDMLSESEAKKMPPENIKSAARSDADDVVANLNDVHTFNIQSSSGVEGALQTNSRLQDGNSEINNEVNGLGNRTTMNGSSVEQRTNSDHKTLMEGGTSPTNASSCELAASISEGTSEPIDEAAITDASVTQGTNIAAANSQNGTRMKSIERLLTERKPSTVRRGRKAVAKSRRGRKV